MKHDSEFYRARIEQAEADIAAAKLANVRDRAIRARNSWVLLSEQHAKAIAERAKVKREKDARDEAMRNAA